jgi:hypothetical protein
MLGVIQEQLKDFDESDPRFDVLREDSRFAAIADHMGVP